MTEEERFQKVYNIYMNFEAELATRGMSNVEPIAVSLTQAYELHEMTDMLKKLHNAIKYPALDESEIPELLQ